MVNYKKIRHKKTKTNRIVHTHARTQDITFHFSFSFVVYNFCWCRCCCFCFCCSNNFLRFCGDLRFFSFQLFAFSSFVVAVVVCLVPVPSVCARVFEVFYLFEHLILEFYFIRECLCFDKTSLRARPPNNSFWS